MPLSNPAIHTVSIHPIRTLYPNKIIVSNKVLGLSRLGSGLGFGPGFILYAGNDNSNKYWNYQTLYPVILLGYNVRIGWSIWIH